MNELTERLAELFAGNDLETLVATMVAAVGRTTATSATYKKRAMRTLKAHGFDRVSPFGAGNVKTATWSTYRQVGATCHSTCPMLGKGCYAQNGNVAMHQRRAVDGLRADLAAVLAAAVIADKEGKPLRLHVSGDFHKAGDKVDWDYFHAVIEILGCFPSLSAWTYTHEPDADKVEAMRILAGDSLAIRWSDHDAIVVDSFDRKRAKGDIHCPAQLTDISCADCGACWRNLGTTRIVFRKH